MSENISAAEYRNEIEQMAENVREAQEEWAENEYPGEAVFNEVDNHQWIIYFNHNMEVLQHSREGPQEWKHLIADGDSWKEVIQAMAFDAMRNDLYNELRS